MASVAASAKYFADVQLHRSFAAKNAAQNDKRKRMIKENAR